MEPPIFEAAVGFESGRDAAHSFSTTARLSRCDFIGPLRRHEQEFLNWPQTLECSRCTAAGEVDTAGTRLVASDRSGKKWQEVPRLGIGDHVGAVADAGTELQCFADAMST